MIGTNLDIAMRRIGIKTQSALAQLSGVPQSTINRILQNQGTTDIFKLLKLAQACGVTVDFLLTGKHASPSDALLLTYITPTEANLLTTFRKCTEQGQGIITIAAQEAHKVCPRLSGD